MATGGVTACVTKVELSISCRDLIDKDVTSKSDPLCVIYLKDGTTKTWQEVARTERIQNSLNPDFSTKIEMSYFFEEVQQIRFSIYDIDNSTDSLLDDDFLGEAECSLGQIVSSKKYVASLLDRSKKHLSKSKITVLADEITDNRVATLQFKATKLDNKDFMGKSDPFLELWRENNGGWTLCHRTEVIKNNLNPTWKPFSVAVQTLCGGDLSRKIKIICHDWDSDGSHDLIGECFTTLSELQDNINKEFFCINPKKKAKKSKYKNSGSIFIMSCKLERRFSFLDFIFGGLQLNFTVGIDFTGSNGDPTSRDSLHFMDPVRPNEYLQALSAVGAVVQDYDTDKLYPALGFGAKIPPSHDVSHEFPLNFRPDNPYCQGIDGIISAYQHALPIIKLWGPTNVSPIINHVARFAYNAQTTENSPTNYYILLILTDGAITDMDETRQAIVNASHLPLSIIIVGVGSADFSAMEMLDGDNGVLRSSSGQPVLRDIVQFVPYRDYKKVGHEASAAALAKAVLAEVPGQVTQYFRGKNLQPTQRK